MTADATNDMMVPACINVLMVRDKDARNKSAAGLPFPGDQVCFSPDNHQVTIEMMWHCSRQGNRGMIQKKKSAGESSCQGQGWVRGPPVVLLHRYLRHGVTELHPACDGKGKEEIRRSITSKTAVTKVFAGPLDNICRNKAGEVRAWGKNGRGTHPYEEPCTTAHPQGKITARERNAPTWDPKDAGHVHSIIYQELVLTMHCSS